MFKVTSLCRSQLFFASFRHQRTAIRFKNTNTFSTFTPIKKTAPRLSLQEELEMQEQRQKRAASLQRLRELMKTVKHPSSDKLGIEAYFIPTADAHLSEYIRDTDKRRAFISGFTGSAGTSIVTLDKALLWTDGRYFLQAAQQLDPAHWVLMRQGEPNVPAIETWLADNLPSGSAVAVDSRLVSKSTADSLLRTLQAKNITFLPLLNNLVDQIWDDKPSAPKDKVFVHPLQYSGQSHQDKIKAIRDHLAKENAEALVVSALDDIAWLFNLRGSDISFNPVFISYALVTTTATKFYIDENKLDDEVRTHLGKEIQIAPYEAIFQDLKQVHGKILLDPAKSSFALYSSCNSSQVVEKPTPISLAKSLKNPVELEGLRQCHLRDAAALVNFFSWLQGRFEANDQTLTECSVSDRLEEFRRAQKDFVSLSFDTICGVGPNGAIIHYKPEPDSCAKVTKDQLFLLDSGGQYKDGTTDVTRTLSFSEPTAHQKSCFTRVLKGVIAIDSLVFPHGTVGQQLDILARAALWKIGLDYRHGTGHGVGAFLNVHEGPQGINSRFSTSMVPFQPGMTTSDEPGYYEDGAFGIRIENVLICRAVDTPFKFGDKQYYGFENITLVPIQTKLIDTSLLNEEEIKWINDHHQKCLEKVGPLVSGKALEWLKRETKPIHR